MKLPRHAEIWLVPYLKDRLRKGMRLAKPKRAWVAITDHYEPMGMGASVETALAAWRIGATSGRGLPTTLPEMQPASARSTAFSTRRRNTGAICSTA